MAILTSVALVFGITLLVVGVLRLLLTPFALVFEARYGRAPRGPHDVGPMFPEPPHVSVVVPAYNEAVVIVHCVRSILRSDHPHLEVVCVDDGSTDDTFALMEGLAAEHPSVRAIRQANAGKGAALNTGIAAAHGEVLLLVDADGLFRPDTVTELLRGFRDERVGAVCGNDRPVNLDRVQTKLLALISHVGTGLMRRALDVVHALPIVSGNVGAFRRDVLERTGPFRTDTLGEDLELTWRIYERGYRVTFAPRALVHAESPSTLRGLWRQRVRWARGLLQTTDLHRRTIGNPRYGFFGPYLAYNTLAQLVLPFVQVLAVVVLAVLVLTDGTSWLPSGLWPWVLFLGIPLSLALLLLAIALDRAPGDLRFLWTVPLWPLYSAMMTFVTIDAVRLELGGAEQRWNKLDRSGTVSVKGLVDDDDDASPPSSS
ncbi:glycosyl transferase family 2 [Beutenbergia cavernae DSM 12333]|uniref:Glycosyl transferase family 2 n=1 Tax=Beutenbergia cavernae (strain ATCC BAA-8 / DSM 12333 / CCUG 43141 / JCM 11478 / NBRC 16432 / NCIMB 13614 / HKI 0122) TaxID=471853 RepID=C5BWE7_BEUC1|nr:glycosyltransferase family 2 protein [Beutenbergia cavernae]ACQ78605.1 glycosyl transferase family 2 [Beutenbergia cavernae DSM 12333]